jgi:Cyclic nucleotide-binding domain
MPFMQDTSKTFKVLSSDNLIYGPIDAATLVQWVKERRIERDTWILLEPQNEWAGAGTLDFLVPDFNLVATGQHSHIQPRNSAGVTVAELRGFERFQPYSNQELEVLVDFCDVVEAAKGDLIIKKGDMSDAMFLVLSGSVQARLRVGGHDNPLGTMQPGEIFGEVAMLSQTARTADVLADVPSRLLRLTSDGFREMMANHSALAAKILFNMSRLLATRLGQRNADLQKDLAASFVWR